MSRKILVDLSSLKNIYSGLGQVALNYGFHFKNNYSFKNNIYELTFLLPRKFFGMFGNEVKYISSTNILRKHSHIFFTKYDVWHSIHQLSRYFPTHKTTKFILTIHDLNYLYEKTGIKKTRLHGKIQRKINRADSIICISDFCKQEVEKHMNLNGKQCKVIYNGVEHINSAALTKPKIEIKEPFFFSIGVILKKKNFHVLLDAMKLMPDKTLYIAGKESEKQSKNEYAIHIKHRIKEEGIHNVVMLGAVSHEEKVWLYKHCEAFIFPSLYEGFGLPIIEALQFGKPVISSKETSLLEIGDKHVAFLENFEPEQIKATILKHIQTMNESPDKVKKAIDYAHSFAYEKHFEQYEKIYTQL